MKKDDRRIAPTEREIAELVSSVRFFADRTLTEYRWLYRMSYTQSVVEEAKVRSTTHTDPTGGLVSARGKQRALTACNEAAEQLRNALAEMRHAESTLLHALSHSDPAERPEPLRYPRTATREELRHAAEAQERRAGRDEAIP